EGTLSPALHDGLAIDIGRGIVRERRTSESPHQSDVRRHRVRIVGEDGAKNPGTDAGTLRHRDSELRAWAAVLMANGDDAGGAPCFHGEDTAELSEVGGARKQQDVSRTLVDHVAHVAPVVVPFPLELPDRFPQCPSDHFAAPSLSMTFPRPTLFLSGPKRAGCDNSTQRAIQP